VSAVPVRRGSFKTGPFAAWLAANGAEIGTPTNPYEVIRYRAYWNGSAKALTHIVYAKENGLLTFTGGAQDHYRAYLAGGSLLDNTPPFAGQFDKPAAAVADPVKETGDAEGLSAKRRRKLLARDGSDCWFCGGALGTDITLEHLVPKSRGGGNDSANLVLAHAGCNNAAANLSISEKVALREKLRTQMPAGAR
jgi:hypothetical protein